MPECVSSKSVKRKDLIGTSNIEDAIGSQRRHFQAKILNGKNPLHFQRGNILGVDLRQWTVSVAGNVAVVGEPIARLRLTPCDSLRFRSRGPDHSSHIEYLQIID